MAMAGSAGLPLHMLLRAASAAHSTRSFRKRTAVRKNPMELWIEKAKSKQEYYKRYRL